MASKKPNVIFVLGGPGAGKGTQCVRIAEKYGYVHLSAGDLLREEAAKPDSSLGQEINEHIKNGSIVPVAVTCKLLENAMKKSGKENFLIDGFPRNKDNVDGWKQAMDGKANVQCVLFFDCDEKTCVARCLDRGGKGSGRTDDNEESLKKRIVTYNESTRPVVELYEKDNLVKRVDASKDVDKKLEELLKHGFRGAILALPFLTTFMDKIATISLVDGTSMQPLLNPTGLHSDWVLIKRWHMDDYFLRKGDIISFESPREPGTYMIKRVKALENEMIYDTTKQKETRVPQGHLWVEGDNKRASYDSRHFGCVTRGLVTGRALYIIWPPKRFGTKLTLLNDDDDSDNDDHDD
ncbi:unnamed protein product [Rotaria sordida]|uniref:UMP-CMP kinase n=1 Tax=Rotaria sordida TaxID=392033 RepID=A0A814AFQ9_9BILA|nr:unnamed protein product [Rotaria sordida]CAF0922854.1 unnamed protein product [Rotaria sordida]CAF3556533.1 unnamed protein product [Rotaria sordida]CAF3832533.1 unnamed protein product [Rotaria sordida]